MTDSLTNCPKNHYFAPKVNIGADHEIPYYLRIQVINEPENIFRMTIV